MSHTKSITIIGLIIFLFAAFSYKFLYKKIEINKVEIVQVKAQKVLGFRKQGKYEEIGSMADALITCLQSTKGIYFAGAPIFLFRETLEESEQADKNETADLEMCVPIFGNAKVKEPFKIYELPAAIMAKIIHKGPYQEGIKTYKKLFAWIEDNGYKIIGPKREAYLNDPRTVKQEDILIEFYAPIDI